MLRKNPRWGRCGRPDLSSNNCGVNLGKPNKPEEVTMSGEDKAFIVVSSIFLGIVLSFVGSCTYKNYSIHNEGKMAGELGMRPEDCPYEDKGEWFMKWDYIRWMGGYKRGVYDNKVDVRLINSLEEVQ